MITCKVVGPLLSHTVADAYVLLLDDAHTGQGRIEQLAETFYRPLAQLLATAQFTGKAHDFVVVNGADGDRPVLIICAGLGSLKAAPGDRLEHCRRAIGSVMRAVERAKAAKVALFLPDAHWFATSSYIVAREIVATAYLATYHFDQYITDESRRYTHNYELMLCAQELLHDEVRVGIEEGQHIGFAVNQARYWCDLPACVLTPTHLADQAKRIASTHNLACTIFDREVISAMGMGGIMGVSKGSAEEPRLVVMEYNTTVPHAQTVALVGKGVTFDSGGLSIKPAARMDEMKDDMAGAAAVLSTMELIAHLKPGVNVIGIAPIVENMPSGTAMRPGDIVTFYNGKTAEVKNTDAEGRLILADALAYAVKHYKLDALIDVATLTGSCAAALGPYFCGLMSQDELLSAKIIRAGRISGDRAWPLPFHNDYRPAVKSTVADLNNEGSAVYRAGAITAGFFLSAFVGSVPWAHMDVAGVSFNVPDVSYYRPGATGFGVRLFAQMLVDWHKADA